MRDSENVEISLSTILMLHVEKLFQRKKNKV
jgi:hypothetical protein